MKTIIATLTLMLSISAFAKSEYKTEYVCGLGEGGDKCAYITYKVRPHKASKPSTELCNDESGFPCEPKSYGVPGFLKQLNDAFKNAGAKAIDPADTDNTGGGGQ